MSQRLENSELHHKETRESLSLVDMAIPDINASIAVMRRPSAQIPELPTLIICADVTPSVTFTPEREAKDLSKDEMKQIGGFLEQLGSASWREREAASKSLRQFGTAALPMITEKMNALKLEPNPEIQRRCENLISAQVYGGLMTIDRLPEVKRFDKPAVGGEDGALGKLGALLPVGELVLAHNPQLADEHKSVQKFADDPALLAKRQRAIEQILDQQAQGKIALNDDQIRNLKMEQLNLKKIDRLCSWLEADLAHTYAEAGETEKAKEFLLRSVKRDPSVKDTYMVSATIRSAKLFKDEEFKKKFDKIAGESKELWGDFLEPQPEPESDSRLRALQMPT